MRLCSEATNNPVRGSVSASLLGREYEGSTQQAGDTRIRGLALLGVILVDALEIGLSRGDRCPWVGLGLGCGRAAKELVDQRAAALRVVEERGVAPWDDLEPRVR